MTSLSRSLTRLFLKVNSQQGCTARQYRSALYSITYKRNRPSRMRTLTANNQHERLSQSATPLAICPYDIQLQMKRACLEDALRKVVNIIRHSKFLSLTADVENSVAENQGCICPLLDMNPAPQPEEFRNKDELNIGYGIEGDPNTIGLIIGRGGESVCVPCDRLRNVKPLHKQVINTFKTYLSQSKFKSSHSDPGSTDDSFWKKLLIRSNEQGQVMLAPDLSCRNITEEIITQARDELIEFYSDGSQLHHNIHSLYLRLRNKGARIHRFQYHVLGETHLYEDILGYKFRISPESFFQLNTPGAHVLYSVVQELVRDSSAQTLLDVGCGTGTIGILMSSLVKQVLGIDVTKQAIEDARFNAKLNGVKNAEFKEGNVRALMKQFLTDGSVLTDETVAILNPNRNGVAKKAIQRLRSCEMIKHLIYISCKPYSNALVNFADLIVPEDEENPGKPFHAVCATGVDMFPQTVHSELVMLFRR